MKVIIVTDYAFVNGGAAKVALDSAVGLSGLVEKVHVFAAVGEPDTNLRDIENLEVTSLGQKKVTEVPLKQSFLGGLWNQEATARMVELLEEFDPKDTVIHIHSWRDALTLSFLPAINRRGFKYVVSGHDYGLACPLAGFFNQREQSVCGHRGLSVGCIGSSCTGGSYLRKNWFVLRHAFQIYGAKVPKTLRHFISLGELNEEVLAPYLSANTKVHRLSNPISTERTERTRAEENTGFVFVGRFSPEKAPQIASEAARLARVPISFVGMGPMEDEIRRVNPDAEILGWKTPEQIQSYLRTRRALVFTSLWYEGQPLVIDEAAALGLPVICSDVSAGARAVRSRNAGELYSAQSIDELATVMNKFDDDEIVRYHSDSSFHAYWSNPQTMERHIRELLAIYSEVLAD